MTALAIVSTCLLVACVVGLLQARKELGRTRAERDAAQAEAAELRARITARERSPTKGLVDITRSVVKASLGLVVDHVLRSELDRHVKAGKPVAILFCDLANSTSLNVELGDEAFRDLVRLHDHITGEVIERGGGQVVKRMGDGFLALFRTADEAVETSRAIQEALYDNPDIGRPLLVRMGLHVAEIVADRGDVFGSGIATTARVVDLAEPDQILLTQAVVDATTTTLSLGPARSENLAGLPGTHTMHPLLR